MQRQRITKGAPQTGGPTLSSRPLPERMASAAIWGRASGRASKMMSSTPIGDVTFSSTRPSATSVRFRTYALRRKFYDRFVSTGPGWHFFVSGASYRKISDLLRDAKRWIDHLPIRCHSNLTSILSSVIKTEALVERAASPVKYSSQATIRWQDLPSEWAPPAERLL